MNTDNYDNNKIEELEKELEHLRQLVYYDELTGIFNRRGFLREAEKEFHLVSAGVTSLERRTGFQIPFSVIFSDIDDFKPINDTYGHACGDEALKSVAHTLKTNLREGDLLGRWGGEEFVMVTIGANAEQARSTGEHLCASIAKLSIACDNRPVSLTASLGIATYNGHGTLAELIHKADKAMYRAKQSGKNQVVISKDMSRD